MSYLSQYIFVRKLMKLVVPNAGIGLLCAAFLSLFLLYKVMITNQLQTFKVTVSVFLTAHHISSQHIKAHSVQ